MIRLFFGNNVFFLEHCRQLFKGQYRVGITFVAVSFILFGNARADEHDLCAGMTLLDIGCVCLHGRKHICKEGKYFWKMLLNEQVYRMAAGGNQNIARTLG